MLNNQSYDLCVIGAGPAGMQAALTAARHGLHTIVIDEQPRCGGQIYRQANIQNHTSSTRIADSLGGDYQAGMALCQQFHEASFDCEFSAKVWEISKDRHVAFIDESGTSRRIHTKRIIIATGAMERPAIVPGWTLPGTMGAGAVQSLIKGSHAVPDAPFVLAGSGPLLLLLAVQLLRLNVRPAAILWQSDYANLRAPDIIKAASQWREMQKGMAWLRKINIAKILLYRKFADFAIHGDQQVESVSFDTSSGRKQIDCALAILHHGVIPSYHLAASCDCALHWDEQNRCWAVTADIWGATNQPDIAVAGDGVRIFGARAARAQGGLAALDALYRANIIGLDQRNELAGFALKTLHQQSLIRPFVDRFMAPIDAWQRGDNTDPVCRCESISQAQIHEIAKTTNCTGPNQMKAFCRAGMGPCQGRMCGLAISQIMARAQNKSVAEIGYMRVRAPIKPVSIAQMAAYHQQKDQQIGGMFSNDGDGHY